MSRLSEVAPAFVGIAHRIVWCIAATVDPGGVPRTRVLHPVWEWDGDRLTGWVATSPLSPKARDLAATPSMSMTYWDASHDTCTADCDAAWEDSPGLRRAGWQRFVDAPAPVGYDPSLIPDWTGPDAAAFGVLRLEPRRLRVMPGTVMTAGEGELLTWRSD